MGSCKGRKSPTTRRRLCGGTNRLAVFIGRLKKKYGMKIDMTRTVANGEIFGVYQLAKSAKKVDRIKSRQYLDQAYPKGLQRN
jgi:hypothetical protein